MDTKDGASLGGRGWNDAPALNRPRGALTTNRKSSLPNGFCQEGSEFITEIRLHDVVEKKAFKEF